MKIKLEKYMMFFFYKFSIMKHEKNNKIIAIQAKRRHYIMQRFQIHTMELPSINTQ